MRRPGRAVAVAVLLLFMPAVLACPACNIFNYLATSIRSSSKIFVGKVLKEVDENHAEVEVTKVLRGDYAIGAIVNLEVYRAKEEIGKTYIFSNPTSWPPRFEVLTLDFEDEIKFLMQEKPEIASVAEAIKRVQGISVETHKLGMTYLLEHHEAAIAPLLAELKSLTPDVLNDKPVFFGTYRLGKLLEALLANPSDAAKDYCIAELNAMAALPAQDIDWKEKYFEASAQAVFLQDMLKHSQKHEALSRALLDCVFDLLPKLSDKSQSDVVYALLLSTSTKLDALQRKIQHADNIALGAYNASQFSARWWNFDSAYPLIDQAIALATRPELKTQIEERVKSWETFHTRAK
jgi:hypothetical protein